MTADATLSARCRSFVGKGRAALGEMFGGDVEVASAGAWVHTAAGRRILNCGGYGVFLLGARHPTVLDAVARQLDANPVATRMLLEPQVVTAAEALVSVAPPCLAQVYFACGGAEAVECAIKLARTLGRTHLVAMESGYHGKTMGALSLTANPVYRDPFHPLLSGVSHVPFGDADSLGQELARHPGTACVVVEPVQGEAGVRIPPAGYLREARALCDEHGALLVLDEIQTGLGRLGHWWGADREGVSPDMLLVGKGLGGGIVPVSAVVATREVFRALDRDPLLHTSTFSGYPLAMAAAAATIRAIRDEGLVARAHTLGERLRPDLDDILTGVLGGRVEEVRGVGLLIGVEFTVPGLVGDLMAELIGQGVLVNHSMNSPRTLRLTPPAVLDDDDVEFLLRAVDRAARAVLS